MRSIPQGPLFNVLCLPGAAGDGSSGVHSRKQEGRGHRSREPRPRLVAHACVYMYVCLCVCVFPCDSQQSKCSHLFEQMHHAGQGHRSIDRSQCIPRLATRDSLSFLDSFVRSFGRPGARKEKIVLPTVERCLPCQERENHVNKPAYASLEPGRIDRARNRGV